MIINDDNTTVHTQYQRYHRNRILPIAAAPIPKCTVQYCNTKCRNNKYGKPDQALHPVAALTLRKGYGWDGCVGMGALGGIG